MTNRELEFAKLGFEYAEGIDLASVVIVPGTGREIRKTRAGKWEAQPWNDNYWQTFDDLLDAARFATRPTGATWQDVVVAANDAQEAGIVDACLIFDGKARLVWDAVTVELFDTPAKALEAIQAASARRA